MRFPAEKDDMFIALCRPRNLCQHALLGRFHDLKSFKAKRIGGDHVQDQPVSVIARFNAVDFGIKLILELGDIGKALQAGIMGILRDGKRIFRTLKIDANRLHRPVFAIGFNVTLHGRHPVAQEDVNVLVLQRGISHRHGQNLHVGFISERRQDNRSGRCRCGNVGPANIGKTHSLAAFRCCKRRRSGKR